MSRGVTFEGLGNDAQTPCWLRLYSADSAHEIFSFMTFLSFQGKVEERKPLLILFNEDAMSAILNAAV